MGDFMVGLSRDFFGVSERIHGGTVTARCFPQRGRPQGAGVVPLSPRRHRSRQTSPGRRRFVLGAVDPNVHDEKPRGRGQGHVHRHTFPGRGIEIGAFLLLSAEAEWAFIPVVPRLAPVDARIMREGKQCYAARKLLPGPRHRDGPIPLDASFARKFVIEDGYSRLDLMAGYATRVFQRRLKFQVNVDNVTDEFYADKSLGYANPRTWRLWATTTF